MEKMINRIVPFLFLLATACGDNCKQENLPCRKLLIFLDKSASVDGQDARVASMVDGDLNLLLDSLISRPGDMVEVHLIHGESIGSPYVLQKTLKEVLPCEDEMGPGAFQEALDGYQQRLKAYRRSIKTSISDYLREHSKEKVTNETDLLGTLEVISDFFPGQRQGEINTVLYISDMVHSKATPRDYYKNPTKGLAETEDCAKRDLVWLKANHKVDPKVFDNLKIKIWFTGADYGRTQNEQMKYYWTALFNELNTSARLEFQ